ncbi:unnamed protein product [Nezara viridula]|uniref:Neuropeptide n=1 Tax=Nezara viridula TaxID=85310 RepID=A0A9P0HFU3_NEZVI|nr:unnamed protein product [Nezara viridula]
MLELLILVFVIDTTLLTTYGLRSGSSPIPGNEASKPWDAVLIRRDYSKIFELRQCSENRCCPTLFVCCIGRHSMDPTYYCCVGTSRKIYAVMC